MRGAAASDGTARTPWSPIRRVREFLETIKFEHSVFALPFAVLTTFIVAGGWPAWSGLGWIVLAMVGMRTFGMAANRLIDAQIDSRNPRTADRALPSGRISRREVAAYMMVSAGIFGMAVSQLDPIAWWLSPIPLAVMIGYPYLKRFTWLSHLGLGVVYLIVPPATWIALTGDLPAGVIVLGFGAMLWVAGFDVLYATVDVGVDRREGLHSIPARFGVSASLWFARTFHAVSVALLAVAGILLDSGPLYYTGIAVAGLLLAYENNLVRPSDLSKLNMAFFTMNGVIAIALGLFVCLDEVLGLGGG